VSHPGKFLALDIFVEFDLEGTLEGIPRLHERAVSLVAHADILVSEVSKFNILVDILELDAHG